jgi:hypothetical protein
VAKKLSKKAVQAAIDARIQRAITGFIIPMMSIPKLYKALKEAVAAGLSDADLKAVVAGFPGIVPSNI